MRGLVLVAVVLMSGCAYNAPIEIAPAYDVYSNYEDKLPGRYALYVDSESLNTTAKVRGYNCSFHSYPVDGQQQFTRSVVSTFQNITEYVEQVDSPLSSDGLISGNFDAMILVEALSYDVRLRVIPGFWSSEMEADIDIASRMKVDSIDGRQLGVSVEGDGDSLVGAGAACSGGAEAIGEATSEAIKKTMERLGERLTNARRLREVS